MQIDPNREFLIRFTANKRHHLGRYFRKLIKMHNLGHYIGDKNALTALSAAVDVIFIQRTGEKHVVKFRKYGRVEFWVK